MVRFYLVVFFSSIVHAALGHAEEPRAPIPSLETIRAAVAKALPLIEKGATGHRENRTCFACHHQGVPILAVTIARSRGFAIDEKELQSHVEHTAHFLDRNRANYLKGKGQGGQVDTAGYALWALSRGSKEPDEMTAAVVEYLLQHNKDLDHWAARSRRPPSEASSFTTTYLALRGLNTYGKPEDSKRIEARVKTVREWLLKSTAKDTEDRVFRLWSLQQANAAPEEVKAAAQVLLDTQQSDGGWRQLDTMKSDAYATGSALVALHEAAGLSASDSAYQRGLGFLLKAQLEDGSWHVRSRSKPFQTYFESGFPHGKDQFISLAASSWATAALALALPPMKK